MTEVILTVVIAILSALLGWTDYNNRKERKTLINAIKSKTAEDMVNLELVDKTKIEAKPPKESKENLVPLEDLTDDEYDEHVIGNG